MLRTEPSPDAPTAPTVFTRVNGGLFTFDSYQQYETTGEEIRLRFVGLRDGEVVFVSVDDDDPFVGIRRLADAIRSGVGPADRRAARPRRVDGMIPANAALLDNFVFRTFSGPEDEPAMEDVAFDLYYLVQTYYEPSNPELQFEWAFQERTLTDSHGNFWFTGLDPGKVYQVRENLAATDTNNNGIPDDQEGLYSTTDDEFTTDGRLSAAKNTCLGVVTRSWWLMVPPPMTPKGDPDGKITQDEIDYAVAVSAVDGVRPPGEPGDPVAAETVVYRGLIFGNFIEGSVHGFKFDDYNGDGQYDPIADQLSVGTGQSDVGLNGAVFNLEVWDPWMPDPTEARVGDADNGQPHHRDDNNGRHGAR